MRKKAFVIVAHPDDEVIWMGGMILQNPDWNWTIFSLCRGNDSDRAPKFKSVCKHFGAKGFMSDLDDEEMNELDFEEIASRIKYIIGDEKFDFIFTHGKNGEYGHLRHKEIHSAVRKMVESREISGRLFCFSYVAGKERAPHDSELKIPVANLKADLIVNLSQEDFQKKRKIVEEIYGFKHPIFETLACGIQEAFDEI